MLGYVRPARSHSPGSCPAGSTSASRSGRRESCARPNLFPLDEPLTTSTPKLRVDMRSEPAADSPGAGCHHGHVTPTRRRP